MGFDMMGRQSALMKMENGSYHFCISSKTKLLYFSWLKRVVEARPEGPRLDDPEVRKTSGGKLWVVLGHDNAQWFPR